MEDIIVGIILAFALIALVISLLIAINRIMHKGLKHFYDEDEPKEKGKDDEDWF